MLRGINDAMRMRRRRWLIMRAARRIVVARFVVARFVMMRTRCGTRLLMSRAIAHRHAQTLTPCHRKPTLNQDEQQGEEFEARVTHTSDAISAQEAGALQQGWPH